jgi:hypothetical protein
MERTSGFGSGLRFGSAWSIRASSHQPSSIKEANKRSCARGLALEPRDWQGGFLIGSLLNGGGGGLNKFSDAAQQPGPTFAWPKPEFGESPSRELSSLVNVDHRRPIEIGAEGRAGRRVEGRNRFASCPGAGLTDDRESVEFHVTIRKRITPKIWERKR